MRYETSKADLAVLLKRAHNILALFMLANFMRTRLLLRVEVKIVMSTLILRWLSLPAKRTVLALYPFVTGAE